MVKKAVLIGTVCTLRALMNLPLFLLILMLMLSRVRLMSRGKLPPGLFSEVEVPGR